MMVAQKVDTTIECVCDFLKREIEKVSSIYESQELTELTKALAELVSARAKGFKVVGVGCGDIDKEGATSIMLMNDHNVAVDLNITDEGTYISEFYALTEDFIPRTYDGD